MTKDDEIDRWIDRLGPARVCEALAPCLSDDRVARIEAVLAERLASVTCVVEDVYDPHNAAAAIRSCEGLGLSELHVVERGTRFDPTTAVTLAAHRWIAIHHHASVADAASALRARGFKVYATLPDTDTTIDTIDVAQPVALVFGNEHDGMTDEAVAACDGAVAIPMHGMTRSFNLSVSVALAVSRVAERRRAHLGAPGDLADDVKARLRARWFALKIRGAAAIVDRYVSGETHDGVAPGPHSGENSGRDDASDE
ncbi:MAG TPA: RNA methyltransferase [Kofleriaceae bacterium]|nr:RNA methyltransferase [Kofleriaceae bacterium]